MENPAVRGGHAVEQGPQPGHVLSELDEQGAHHDQRGADGEDHLGVHGKFAPAEPLAYDLLDDQEADAAEDDKGTGHQVQQHIVLVGNQILEVAQNVEAELLKAATEWNRLMPRASRGS